MKNILMKLMTSAALVITLGGALEAQTIHMQATVPFAWQARGQQLNAGDYVITRNASLNVVAIQSETGGKAVCFITMPEDNQNQTARLVFHRYGDRYFLAEVHGAGVSVKMPVTREEKNAAEMASARTANAPEVATVFIEASSFVN